MRPKALSNLELEIMKVVWECQRCSVRDVLRQVGNSRKLAYTTVATILQRLHKKGLVERKSDKLAYIYSPMLSKKSYGKQLTELFIKRFVRSFGDVAIASFAEGIESLPLQKRNNLLTQLQNYDKSK